MQADFLGSGWNFPVQNDGRGNIAVASGVEKLRQSIRIILSTAKGERVMRPEFGCDIHEFAFATCDTSTLTLIQQAVEDALVLWEPRINVLAVDTDTSRLATDGQLLIQVRYRIRNTNAEDNLVYPFYLNRGE